MTIRALIARPPGWLSRRCNAPLLEKWRRRTGFGLTSSKGGNCIVMSIRCPETAAEEEQPLDYLIGLSAFALRMVKQLCLPFASTKKVSTYQFAVPYTCHELGSKCPRYGVDAPATTWRNACEKSPASRPECSHNPRWSRLWWRSRSLACGSGSGVHEHRARRWLETWPLMLF